MPARATPLQRRRRLHLQAARCSARRLPGFTIRQLFPSSPCHHALAALQPQAACQATSLTDLQAAAARALFKPRGVGDMEQRLQLDNTTICLVRRVALSCKLQSYHSWRSAWHASSPSAPLQHANSHDCPARPPGQPPVPAAS